MVDLRTGVLGSIVAGALLGAGEARAADWVLWADGTNGVPPRTYPRLAFSDDGDVYFTYLSPQPDGNGVVLRAHVDDPARKFTPMPPVPLAKPMPNMPYANVFTMTTTALGEPVLGLSANTGNTSPLLVTWDEGAGKWLVPPIDPPERICNHNLYAIARAPNGDIWAGCQWSGVYRSTDDGRSFEFVDVSALVKASTPSYFPTRAAGTDNLGAMYGLKIGPDGAIYFGTETGGVVYSTDDGASFRPLDQQPDDLMSPMARATNSGNIAGIGVTPDGRVMVQGVPGGGAYPPADGTDFYVFDLVARTTTPAVGLPDYFVGGQTVSQILTLPGGEMFFHSNHDRVDPMTGTPQLGGVLSSTDGVTWGPRNDGIDEIFKVPNMNFWVDGLGHGDGDGLAAYGDDLYVVTATGKIFVLMGEPGGTTGTTGDTGTTGGTGGTAGTDTGGGSGPATDGSGAGTGAPTTGGDSGGSSGGSSGGVDASSGGSASDGASGAGAGGDDQGCACRASRRGEPTGALLLVGLVLGARARGRRG